MSLHLRPRSIRARFTLAAGVLALIVFVAIGTVMDFAIVTKAEDQLYRRTERAATDWAGTLRPGSTPQATPATGGQLIQAVDSRGRVIAANPAAAGLPPISSVRPSATDRFHYGTTCAAGGRCLFYTAVRVPPVETQVLWQGEPHFVYAALPQPPMFTRHRLEILTATGALLAAALSAWATWWVVGRTLRPVAAIRAKTAEISVSDLSQRVPEPPGQDEIAQLARTSNQTLARLEEAVQQQRHFASVVSHELRSPVAGLHAQLEEALLYPGDVDPQQTFQAALSTTERLQAIIDEVLAFARVRTAAPAAPESIDLAALAKEESAARVSGPLVHTLADSEVRVLGNRIQLIGVLNNLLVNAQRHAETGVAVTVRAEDGQAVVTVSDDGHGIAPEDRERIFEPFVRLNEGRRRDPGGSGLGLAICRAVVHAHDGTLTIEDSPKGACFVLRLPLQAPEPPLEPEAI
ncbi:two-component sensor histidine kinase [Microtetraspora sp. NBRC 13810]|uniref:HAMP domain-containing sensor histidine kinase n=1 Tax=Microtetraspora sp. NBRC 13810 TaxID=3030990 RepID=UPI0024A4B52B|nr:HAMP domain-containing sensor histidine kinase [Microtetraspora sp. NBRC 13810]GLW11101.1 two-component sensor histidine kinase [Microtetraspora sp. NBRC 13810]